MGSNDSIACGGSRTDAPQSFAVQSNEKWCGQWPANNGETEAEHAARVEACDHIQRYELPSADAMRYVVAALMCEHADLCKSVTPRDGRTTEREWLFSVIRWMRAHYGHVTTDAQFSPNETEIQRRELCELLHEVELRDKQHRLATHALVCELKRATETAGKMGAR